MDPFGEGNYSKSVAVKDGSSIVGVSSVVIDQLFKYDQHLVISLD